MSRYYILDDAGGAVSVSDVLQWARWYEESDNRIVAQDTVAGMLVSTVFLAIDHRFAGEGPPILWETMVFPQGTADEVYCERYASRSEALAGHVRAVEAAKRRVL